MGQDFPFGAIDRTDHRKNPFCHKNKKSIYLNWRWRYRPRIHARHGHSRSRWSRMVVHSQTSRNRNRKENARRRRHRRGLTGTGQRTHRVRRGSDRIQYDQYVLQITTCFQEKEVRGNQNKKSTFERTLGRRRPESEAKFQQKFTPCLSKVYFVFCRNFDCCLWLWNIKVIINK